MCLFGTKVLGLLMVYDRIECLGERGYRSSQVSHSCRDPAHVLSLCLTHILGSINTAHTKWRPWNGVFGDACKCPRSNPSFWSGPYLFSLWTEKSSHRCQGHNIVFCIPVFFLPISSPPFHQPLPVVKQILQNALPYAARTSSLIHQACE